MYGGYSEGETQTDERCSEGAACGTLQKFSSRIDSLKWRLSALDLKGEGDTLSEAELEDIHDITASIHLLSRRKWLKEGDANVNVCARVSLRVGSMSRVY
jgi:hypothetical protein